MTDSRNSIRIGACQLPEIREDIETALQWIETYAGKAQADGVKLLCFPECFLQGYLTDVEAARQHALDLGSPSFQSILQRLTSIKPTLVIGLIESHRGKLYNTAVVVARGCLIGPYRKTHLLPAESIFSAGDIYPVFEASGLKFGINICYDTNSPEAAAALADQGARLILWPANNMLPRESAEKWKHRHNDIRSQRAIETGLWLLSSDVTGKRENCISYGPTAAIKPNGEVHSQVPLEEVGYLCVDIET